MPQDLVGKTDNIPEEKNFHKDIETIKKKKQ